MKALITGATSGIGLEFAKILAAQGYDLFLIASSKQMPKDVDLSSVRVDYLSIDLSAPGSAKKVQQAVKNADLSIDILINNAGFGDFALFKDADIDKLTSMMHLNMTTLTELTHLFLPHMLAQRSGRILNVASTASFIPGPYMSVYYATKHYVLAFSEAIAEELSQSGVTVTALCPGPTRSNFGDTSHANKSPLFKGRDLPSSADVALFGYRSMMNGKRVAVHGFYNRLTVMMSRFVPRSFVTRYVAKTSKPKS